MIDGLEKHIHKTASQFSFIEKAETLLKTPNTIKVKLSVTQNKIQYPSHKQRKRDYENHHENRGF